MKGFTYATILLITLAFSCSKIESGIVAFPLETSLVNEVSALPISEKDNSYFVEMNDINKYVDFKILESLSNGKTLELKSIEPIRSKSGEISMYVIKYNDGWDVISSDKRSPMVLASSETGEFEYSEAGPHRFYFDMVAEDIQNFITYEDQQFVLTKSLSEKSNENIEYWDVITASEDFISSYLPRPLDSLELEPWGHWELVDIESQRETYDEVDHLISFEWGQKSPFNLYCPLITQNSGTHAPAGCVAVSGAQILAYLQELFNLEIEMPSTVTGVGYIGNNPVQYSDYTTDLWQTIKDPNPQVAEDAAAKIISRIGYLVDMQYGNNASGANHLLLQENVFSPNGISSTRKYDTYQTNYSEIIKENLLNNLPILVAASYSSNNDGAHSFIIDGYKRYRNKYTCTYAWVYDGEHNKPLPTYPEKVEIEYSSPVIEQIRMNWGFANEYENNDNLYSLIGDWEIQYEGNNLSYEYNRELIYGFSKN